MDQLSSRKRIGSLLTLLLLVIVLPAIIFLVQQPQSPRNYAQEITKNPVATAPRIDITSPTNGSAIVGDTSINVAVLNAAPVQTVEYYVDNKQVGTLSQKPFIWVWKTASVPSGSHTITVRAYDNDSKVATKTITVTK